MKMIMFGLGDSDNGDRYRTTGARLQIGNYSLGLN